MEIPLSPRTPSVTTNHDLAENSSAMTKDSLSLVETSTADGQEDKKTRRQEGQEGECVGAVGEDFDEDEEQVRSRLKFRTINNVPAYGKRTGNNSNRNKTVRKRRVTANLSATKYDIGEFVFVSSLTALQRYHGN